MWTKYSKVEAGYVTRNPAHRPTCCGNCTFFRPAKKRGGQWVGGCDIVEGPIRSQDGCNLWKPERHIA